jgi:hypothetical protein
MERDRLERKGLGAAREVLSLMPVLWGLTLLGVAMWLLRSHAPAAALPCLAFSAGYFWFAWSLYKDPTWDSESTSREVHNAAVFEPRAKPEPNGLNRNSRVLQKSPGRHNRPRSSRDRAA